MTVGLKYPTVFYFKIGRKNDNLIVFYNGIEQQAEKDVLKLSDLYYHREATYYFL